MLMILARLVRSESFWAVVKVRSPHNGLEVSYPRSECSTNTRKKQGASESATATTQAAGADRLRRGQLPQCAPRLTSVRRGAVQPLWRPATGRVLRLWRT